MVREKMRTRAEQRKSVDGKLILFHREDDFDDGIYEDVDGAIYTVYATKNKHWFCDGCGKEYNESRARRYWTARLNNSYCSRCVRIPAITELLHAYITEMKAVRKGN